MIPEPIRTSQVEGLPVRVYESEAAMGRAAAADMAALLRDAIAARGEANVILATGNSQLAFLRALRDDDSVDWSKVRVFHMDEYVGIDPTHRASFPRFLREHFLGHVEGATFFPMAGEPDRVEEICRDYEAQTCVATPPTRSRSASARTVTWPSTTRPTPTSTTRCG
jgi:glucosamine-6-phosphate deaminase